MRALLTRLADLFSAAGLGDPAFRLFQRLQSLVPSGPAAVEGEGPLPPPYLRVLTCGTTSSSEFLEAGRVVADTVVGLAEQFGAPLGPSSRVLDFGCGCGRVARFLLARTPVELHGCDLNPKLVAWCARHLRGSFQVTRPEPPLPYAEGAFDVVYALSVFTHLHDQTARAWLAELARITRPGGLAFISFWDEHAPQAARFRGELEANGFYLKRQGAEGSNLLTGFFTHDALAHRAEPHWLRVHSAPSPGGAVGQALMVLKRR